MTRVAIVGANGQVGAEVCLRLRQAEGIEVVPVVRNVSGSAFLRLNGVECRHGRVVDPADVRRLIGDCDVVVNMVVSMTSIPRADRETNRAVVRSIVAGAKPRATIVFASTIMVYAPATRYWLPDTYGLEKLLTEKLLAWKCRESSHPLFILRMGHVLGDLQNITRNICGEIRSGEVTLPEGGFRASNSVFTSSIVEAIVQAARGTAKPGTYDLITSPQWTWLQVYEYYASILGLPLEVAADCARHGGPRFARAGTMRRLMHHFTRNNFWRERLTFLVAFLPLEMNQRIYLRYLQARARSEIKPMGKTQKIESPIPDWRELKVRPMPYMADPVTLMARYPLRYEFGPPRPDSSAAWRSASPPLSR